MGGGGDESVKAAYSGKLGPRPAFWGSQESHLENLEPKLRSAPSEAATRLHVQPLSPLPRVLDQQLQRIFVACASLGRPQPADLGANVLLDARVDEVPRLHALSAESAPW